MAASTPRISAIICTRNRPELIGQAVESVLANEHPQFELVVVDQSDTYDSKRALSEVAGDPRLSHIQTDRVGLSVARNIGISSSRAPLLAFTDDDCVAAPDWLARVEQAFADNPDVDLLYGQVKAPDELRDTEGTLPRLEFTQRRWVRPQDRFHVFGMGANFAARRALFEQIGPFDEMLGAGGPLPAAEDFDLMYRAHLARITRMQEPSASVEHYGLRRRDQWQRTLYDYGMGDAGFYLKQARCGDLSSIWFTLKKVARVCGRALGRRRSYFRGFVYGSLFSLRYRIDRKRRLYLARHG